ncbi:glycosyltransferase family 4 protein [uncultured Parabacteroides sp.]|mgnify:CR=1 FL=1|uniref:glycosyltransferase family 4 protein n=1 Tax=uncultured Parabacteroides sp. TaxID=512312 RepID=UPI0028037893|nr:glycosyltransferase family 4 protein [uncultured Parabacteroides sp.]
MDPKFKIVLINHSFQIDYYSRRWQLFAKSYPNVEVVLFAPAEFEWYKDSSYTYGKSSILKSKEVHDGNFHKRLFRIVEHKYRGWNSPDLKKMLLEESPNIIYHLGTHNMLSLAQVIKIRNRYLPSTKVIAFSMRGPALNLTIKKTKTNIVKWIARRVIYFYLWKRLIFINKNVDAFFCHYPMAIDCFREEGYNGPIYMQTQVGVNEEWFHKDMEARNEIRAKYNISDYTYVFGSATRFSPSKGVDLILKALPNEGDWKYLMMGSGVDEDLERLKGIIKERHIEDKVIITGFIDWYEIAKYWNAIDCAIHVPITTLQWEETFSLSVIQPQITGKPVIGSTSGSVPYQIGFKDMLVPENNVEALAEKIKWVLENKDTVQLYGEKMYQRTHACFEIKHLNDLFYRTLVEDVLNGTFDLMKVDMTKYNTNENTLDY